MVGRHTIFQYFFVKSDLCSLFVNRQKQVVRFTCMCNGERQNASNTRSQKTCLYFLADILNISLESGIILDRVYTGKAVRGMVKEMQTNPERFKGTRILFVHTGTVFFANSIVLVSLIVYIIS